MKSKILYFGMSGNLGGIESFIINFWRKFNKDRIQIDFIKTEKNICFENELLSNGSEIFTTLPRNKNLFKYLYSLYTFFKMHPEYKIMHLHQNTCSSIEPALLAKLYGKKVIFHSHSEWKGKKRVTKFLHLINRPILNFIADERLACSEAAGKWMYSNHDFKVIKNAIDVKSYTYDEEKRIEIRKKFNIENKFVMGNIGRFSYVKNHEFLIDIFNYVHKKNPETILMLVGDGELRQVLEKKVEILKLSEVVIFTGVSDNVKDLLQAMDVFVFPSLFEGLGIVTIEAQAAGLPCIVADTIPLEANITNLMKRISLNEDVSFWGSKIISSYENNVRKNTYDEIKSAGYDIESVVIELEKIYIDIV